eukprot:1414034-Pyramimonas_sp.AAC.1
MQSVIPHAAVDGSRGSNEPSQYTCPACEWPVLLGQLSRANCAGSSRGGRPEVLHCTRQSVAARIWKGSTPQLKLELVRADGGCAAGRLSVDAPGRLAS